MILFLMAGSCGSDIKPDHLLLFKRSLQEGTSVSYLSLLRF